MVVTIAANVCDDAPEMILKAVKISISNLQRYGDLESLKGMFQKGACDPYDLRPVHTIRF